MLFPCPLCKYLTPMDYGRRRWCDFFNCILPIGIISGTLDQFDTGFTRRCASWRLQSPLWRLGWHRRLPRFLRYPHVPQGDTTGPTRSFHYLTFCLLFHCETYTHHLGLRQFFWEVFWDLHGQSATLLTGSLFLCRSGSSAHKARLRAIEVCCFSLQSPSWVWDQCNLVFGRNER